MRESSFNAQDHSAIPSGAAIITDTRAMDSLLDRLQNGDPTKGWAGDPRLCVAFDRQTQRFELWRREHDEEYRLVARSRPGVTFPADLIEVLVARDSQSGFDVGKYVREQNAQIDREREQRIQDKMTEDLRRVAFGMKNDGVI